MDEDADKGTWPCLDLDNILNIDMDCRDSKLGPSEWIIIIDRWKECYISPPPPYLIALDY